MLNTRSIWETRTSLGANPKALTEMVLRNSEFLSILCSPETTSLLVIIAGHIWVEAGLTVGARIKKFS